MVIYNFFLFFNDFFFNWFWGYPYTKRVFILAQRIREVLLLVGKCRKVLLSAGSEGKGVSLSKGCQNDHVNKFSIILLIKICFYCYAHSGNY